MYKKKRRGGREREIDEKGKHSSLFLPISSRFGGYPPLSPPPPPTVRPILFRMTGRPANPLIPFHLPIANRPLRAYCVSLCYYSGIVRVTQFNSLIYFPCFSLANRGDHGPDDRRPPDRLSHVPFSFPFRSFLSFSSSLALFSFLLKLVLLTSSILPSLPRI